MANPKEPANQPGRREAGASEPPKAFDVILEGGRFDGTRMRVSADVRVVKKEWREPIKDGEADSEHRRMLGYYITRRTKPDSTGTERVVFEARGHEGEQSEEPDPNILPKEPATQAAAADPDHAAALMRTLASQPRAKGSHENEGQRP